MDCHRDRTEVLSQGLQELSQSCQGLPQGLSQGLLGTVTGTAGTVTGLSRTATGTVTGTGTAGTATGTAGTVTGLSRTTTGTVTGAVRNCHRDCRDCQRDCQGLPWTVKGTVRYCQGLRGLSLPRAPWGPQQTFSVCCRGTRIPYPALTGGYLGLLRLSQQPALMHGWSLGHTPNSDC